MSSKRDPFSAQCRPPRAGVVRSCTQRRASEDRCVRALANRAADVCCAAARFACHFRALSPFGRSGGSAWTSVFIASASAWPFCESCGEYSERQHAALLAAPKPTPAAFDSARSDRDMTHAEARAVCQDRGHVWARTAKGRCFQGPYVEGVGAVMHRTYEVGYRWSTPYSHYASGRVYTCVMGRGPTLAEALIAAEKRHASNLKHGGAS